MRKVLIIKFCTTMAIGNIKLRAGDCEKIFIQDEDMRNVRA